MSNISNNYYNYEGFDKEAGINAQVAKNVGKVVTNAKKRILAMPEDIKHASKSLDEFKKNVSQSGLKTKKPIDEIIKEQTQSDFGLTGMLASGVKEGTKWAGKKVYKKMPEGVKKNINKKIEPHKVKAKQVSKKIERQREKMDKGIADLDMKLGSLGYKYAPGKTKNLFVGTKKIELAPSNNKGAKQYAEFKVTGISEPVKKTRDLVVPIAGGIYLADKLEKLKYQTPEQQALNSLETEGQSNNPDVIDKVSFMLENKDVKENTNVSAKDFSYYLNKMSKLASQASTQLMLASYENKSLMEKVSQLEMEKSLIKIAYENEARERNAKELAGEMLHKGIIKKADYEGKVKDLYQMDKQSFEIFRKTIHDIKIEKQASDCKDGVDSLQFMLGESDEKAKLSMEEAFSQYS